MGRTKILQASILGCLLVVAGCGDDDRRGSDSGVRPVTDASTSGDGDRPPARPDSGLDSGPSGVTCYLGSQGGGAACSIGYVCSNTFTYQVECDGINCECRENDLGQSSFEQLNFCGDITQEFQAMLARDNCGWDFALEGF